MLMKILVLVQSPCRGQLRFNGFVGKQDHSQGRINRENIARYTLPYVFIYLQYLHTKWPA